MQILGRAFRVGRVDYSVTTEINSGGFGTIYRAEPAMAWAEPLVVKVPALHVINDAEYRRRFQREARILANINHPNVVRTLGLLGFDDGALLLVQEMVQGAKEFFSQPYVRDSEHLSFALQVLYGLRVTHGTSAESRAIHRDISPRNILVDRAGIAKIIDFGLAKEDPRTTTMLTVAGEGFGTPGCMAPEQTTDSASVDHRADLFGLGRTLAACIQHRRPEFVDLSALRPPWASVIQELAAYDVNDRFADATTAIRRFLHDFRTAGVLPEHLPHHAAEFAKWDQVPDEWVQVLDSVFQGALDVGHLELAYEIDPKTRSNSHFKCDRIFKRLLDDVIRPYFSGTTASFEDCDPLGLMIRKWYPDLHDSANKESAFRILCRVAVDYHRYDVMGEVRRVYALESDQTMQAKLLAVLDEEDPISVIQGRGVLPRSP